MANTITGKLADLTGPPTQASLPVLRTHVEAYAAYMNIVPQTVVSTGKLAPILGTAVAAPETLFVNIGGYWKTATVT